MTRWQLRRAVRIVNQHFECLGLAQHPDKTFIGASTKVLIFSTTVSIRAAGAGAAIGQQADAAKVRRTTDPAL